jgi:hypothetical protein
MTASGLGNFRTGGIGIMGQQDWQRQARDEAFKNLYGRGLQMQTSSTMDANPMQRFRAGAYATSFFPQGATFTGGSTAGGGMLGMFAGQRVPVELGGQMKQGNWWNQNQMFRFPYS